MTSAWRSSVYEMRQSPTRNPFGTPLSGRRLLFGAVGSAATLSIASRISLAFAGCIRARIFPASRAMTIFTPHVRTTRTARQACIARAPSLLRRGDPSARAGEREIRIPGQMGNRPAVGARALSDRKIREEAGHRDELPEGHQS